MNIEELAKQNGFILMGESGVGKSTLINILFDEEVAEVNSGLSPIIEKPQVYYLKLNSGRCLSLIDTPGLDYTGNENKLDDIIKIISEKKIDIKGILFLININLRFIQSQKDSLLSYHKNFPSKNFWKQLIIIFTHCFNDQVDEEKMQKRKEGWKRIFSNLMERVKNVSDIIDYKELNIKFYNSYCPQKNEREKIQNKKSKEDLEVLLNEFCKKEPLYRKKTYQKW